MKPYRPHPGPFDSNGNPISAYKRDQIELVALRARVHSLEKALAQTHIKLSLAILKRNEPQT